MPELMINATPTAPAGNTSGANAPGQYDAASADGVKADAGQGAGSPFAATLKSHMDRQAGNRDHTATQKTMDAQREIVASGAALDIAALLLGLEPAAMSSLPALATEPAEAAAMDSGEAAAQALPPVLAMLAATVTAPVQVGSAAASVPAGNSATANSAPIRLADAALSAQPSVLNREAAEPAARPEPQGLAPAGGKFAAEPAITADLAPGSEAPKADMPAVDFRALLDRAVATPATGTNSAPVQDNSVRVDTPLGQTGWNDDIGQKLTWMASNNRQQAELVLTPPQLGRVEVSLTMNGDQATATFTSANPAVREALEASLERLREVLADAGVNLGQTHVGSESPRQSSSRDQAEPGAGGATGYGLEQQAPVSAVLARSTAGRSMIDVFA